MLSKLTIIALLLSALGIFSCSKEDLNLKDLNETIFVRHQKADMPAYIHGNGSEKVFLIILHGGPGGHGLQYRVNSMISEVEKNNAVVYFDQRGSGNSQGSYSEEEVNLDLLVEDVLALAKLIKAKYGADSKLFLMGHSWGGTLGTATLLKEQDDFSGWIDVDGDHDPKGVYEEYKVVLKELADEQIALGNSVAHWQAVIDLVQTVGLNFNLEDYFKLNATAHRGEAQLTEDQVVNEIKADYGEDTQSQNRITFTWNKIGISKILDVNIGIWENLSLTDRLPEIKIPSLVLWGKYDLVVPTVNAQEAFDHLGSSDKEIFIFEKSAHSPMFNEPALFADKLIEFINSH